MVGVVELSLVVFRCLGVRRYKISMLRYRCKSTRLHVRRICLVRWPSFAAFAMDETPLNEEDGYTSSHILEGGMTTDTDCGAGVKLIPFLQPCQ